MIGQNGGSGHPPGPVAVRGTPSPAKVSVRRQDSRSGLDSLEPALDGLAAVILAREPSWPRDGASPGNPILRPWQPLPGGFCRHCPEAISRVQPEGPEEAKRPIRARVSDVAMASRLPNAAKAESRPRGSPLHCRRASWPPESGCGWSGPLAVSSRGTEAAACDCGRDMLFHG
jgi:hypothetical protein